MTRFEADALLRTGICKLDEVFSDEIIRGWNQKLNPLFEKMSSLPRSEVSAVQLFDLGIFHEFFSEKMRFAVRSIMSDAVIYDFHVYEIAANQTQSHIMSERLAGWHPDIKPLPGIDLNLPHYMSIFVYLTSVGENDGAFEFLPVSCQESIRSGLESVKVQGPSGTVFVWNKAFYHRASPNLGPVRRRLLKVSFQHNYLENANLASSWVSDVGKRIADSDEFLAYVFGKYHKASHHGAHLLPETPGARVGSAYLDLNAKVERFTIMDELRLQVKRWLKVPT